MTVISLQARRAAASPVVSAAQKRVPLDESNEAVQALLAFDPRGGLDDGALAKRLNTLLDNLAMDCPPNWGSEDDATPAEIYVHEAIAYYEVYINGCVPDGLGKFRFCLEFAYDNYLRKNVLRRFGSVPGFTFYPYTNSHGRTRVAVFLSADNKADPVTDLSGDLQRHEVEGILGTWHAGFVRSRRDGQAELRAQAGAILSTVN